jgi:hypothetical protein
MILSMIEAIGPISDSRIGMGWLQQGDSRCQITKWVSVGKLFQGTRTQCPLLRDGNTNQNRTLPATINPVRAIKPSMNDNQFGDLRNSGFAGTVSAAPRSFG